MCIRFNRIIIFQKFILLFNYLFIIFSTFFVSLFLHAQDYPKCKKNKYHNCYLIHFNNGNLFEGIVKNGKANGKGRKSWAKGSKFEGEFLDGNLFQGKYTFPNGDTVEGFFKNNRAEGLVKKIYKKDGRVFDGYQKDGLYDLSKQHQETYIDGSIYIGNFNAQGKRHGQGILTSNLGEKKIGNWWNGIFLENKKSNEVKKNIEIKKESRENNLNNAKLECEEIGFKKETEAFGECVLDLTE
tara:strand:- start:1194 stop:1916 length:723 start_codon:yes stop_codon:yes gene_type:complete